MRGGGDTPWRSARFLLSTLAKGMVITLPVVLLAIAWWQRGRIVSRDIVRMVPYLLIGAVMAGIEIWTQHLAGRKPRSATKVFSAAWRSPAAPSGSISASCSGRWTCA